MNWTADGPACRSRWVSGSATLTMKKSSSEVKTPASRTSRAPRGGRVSIGTCGGAMAGAIVRSLFPSGVEGPRGGTGRRAGRSGGESGGNLVQEPVDVRDPAVGVQDQHVEPDDELVAEAPGEPGDVVVRVDRARQREREPGELALHGGDGRVDLVPALGRRDRVVVHAVRRPQLVDALPAGRR